MEWYQNTRHANYTSRTVQRKKLPESPPKPAAKARKPTQRHEVDTKSFPRVRIGNRLANELQFSKYFLSASLPIFQTTLNC